jgi:hypothetical protein
MAAPVALPLAPISNNPARKSRLRTRPVGPVAGIVAPDLDLDRRRFCEDILTDGFVNSFVDFFYLTHRPVHDKDSSAASPDGESNEIQVPPNEMLFVRGHLTQAEGARRQGDTGTVYGAYSALAQHYHSMGDSKTCVYFYEKCLEISRLTNDHRGEMASNHDLGLTYQHMAEPSTAARYHERHLVLAAKHGADTEEKIAAGELVKVYQAIAEGHEASDEKDAAVQVNSVLFFRRMPLDSFVPSASIVLYQMP